MKDRLARAVTDGKLTQEQADKIIAKHAELKEFMVTLEDKTDEERREAMKAKHEELKQWAEDNDIPTKYLRFLGHHGHHGHHGSKNKEAPREEKSDSESN